MQIHSFLNQVGLYSSKSLYRLADYPAVVPHANSEPCLQPHLARISPVLEQQGWQALSDGAGFSSVLQITGAKNTAMNLSL